MSDLQVTIQVAQLIAYIVAGAIFVIMLKADLRIVKHDIKIIQNRQDSQSDNIKQITAVLTTVAVQNTRLNSIEEDIREIRHGKGFVQRELIGEWSAEGKIK